MKNPNIGDIVEIPLSMGFAYAQYTHKHPQYGALLRVYDCIFPSKQSDVDVISSKNLAFSCFLPVSAVLKRGIFGAVSNANVRGDFQQFPMFRAGIINRETKKVETWWLWDGQREWRVGNLTPEQRKFPIRGIWNDTYLIEKIEAGWKPETDQF